MTRPTRPRTPLLYHGALGSAPATWRLLFAVLAFYVTALIAHGALTGLGQLVAAQCALGLTTLLSVALATRGAPMTSLASLGLVAPRPRALLGAVLLGATAWYPNLCLALWVQAQTGGATRVPGLDRLVEAPAFPLTVICVSLFPALCEELAFRGLWARALAARFGLPLAIAVSAPVFGLYHLSSAQLLPATLLGVVLAWTSLVSGSLWISITIHAVNNATALLASRGRLGWAGELLQSHPVSSIFLALAIILVGLVLVASAAPPRPAAEEGA